MFFFFLALQRCSFFYVLSFYCLISFKSLKMNTLNSTCVSIKDLKKGDFFTLKDYSGSCVPEDIVWIRGSFERSTKSYSCYKYVDANHEHFFRASKLVFVDFDF